MVNAETGERPRMPARKGSAFSIHSVTASVANIAAAAASHRERPRAYTLPTVEREMTEVTSRPESLYERDDIDEEDEDEDEAEEPGPGPTGLLSVDKPTRNRAVSSGGKLETERSDRLSISDRFANLSVLGKLGSPGQGDKPLHSPPAETSSIVSGPTVGRLRRTEAEPLPLLLPVELPWPVRLVEAACNQYARCGQPRLDASFGDGLYAHCASANNVRGSRAAHRALPYLWVYCINMAS